jgi:hypothetical protein
MKFYKLCREVVQETFGADWMLTVGVAGREISADELCIWDFVPEDGGLIPLLGPAKRKTHFFLLQKNSVATFQALPGASELNVILKPVTRASLRAFLSGAGEYVGDGRAVVPNCDRTLRAERDEMLQL